MGRSKGCGKSGTQDYDEIPAVSAYLQFMPLLGLLNGSLSAAYGPVSGGFSFSSSPSQKKTVQRHLPERVVTFEGPTPEETVVTSTQVTPPTTVGQGMSPKALSRFITRVYVEETSGFEMNFARVTVQNPGAALTDEAYWREQGTVTMDTGYAGTGLQQRGGKFIIQKSRYSFKPDQPDGEAVELFCYGEEVRMAQRERRKNWTRLRDSEIAEKIAKHHGWKIDIQKTNPMHASVIQANENDYRFLARRALLYGYEIYVENGVLHFHEPRYNDRGLRLVYRESGGVMSSCVVSVVGGANDYVMTDIEPLNKDIIQERSSAEKYVKDPVHNLLATNVPGDVRSYSPLSKIPDGDDNIRFALHSGHEQTRSQIRSQVEAFSRSTRYLVRAEATLVGTEDVHVRDIVELVNVGKHSGKYIVRRATHDLNYNSDGSSPTYTVYLEMVRAFTGSAGGQVVTKTEKFTLPPIEKTIDNAPTGRRLDTSDIPVRDPF